MFMLYIRKAALLLLFLGPLFTELKAQPILASGAAPNSVIGVISARWRGLNNAGGGSAALYLGNANIGGGGTNRVQYSAGGMYLRPGNNSISFRYDKPNNRLTASINANTITYNNVSAFILGSASLCRMNYLNINLRNTGSFTGQVRLANINLDGNILSDVNVPGGSNQIWNISNYDFSDGFLLTGTIVLDAGTYGGNENAKVEMLVGEKSPVTSTALSSFCDGGNSTVSFNGLLPGKTYTVSYNIDGVAATSPSFSSDALGAGAFSLGPLSNADFGKTFTANVFSPSGGCNWSGTVNNAALLVENSSCIILSVTGMEVKASRKEGKIIVDWKTNLEANSNYFQVETSAEGITWKKVGLVPAKGNSNAPSRYSYTIMPSNFDDTYIRIKMVDRDGNYVYSRTIKLAAANSVQITVSPNPVSAKARVSIPLPRKINQLSIMTLDGRTLDKILMASAYADIDMHSYAPGMYLIRLVLDNGEVEVRRLVKQ